MVIRITHPYIQGFWYVEVPQNHPAKKFIVNKAGCPVGLVRPGKKEHIIIVDECIDAESEYGGEYYIFSGTDEFGQSAIYELFKRNTLSLTELEL